jgi:hypothetical protein
MLKNKKKQQQTTGKGTTRSGTKTPGTNKFAPPTADEKNRRVIDGKAMYWLTKVRRWIEDKNPPGAQVTGPIPIQPPTIVPPVIAVGGTISTRSSAEREVALNNVTHAINTALRSFADMVDHQS